MARKTTVFQELIARGADPLEAVQVIRFIIEYGRALDALGAESIRVEDYCEAVGIGRAQGFRRLKLFRTFFAHDEDETPARYWQLARPIVGNSSLPVAVGRLAVAHPESSR